MAAAAGVDLHDDPWEMNVLATQRGSAHVPSMLEDIEAGRPTEIDLITGAVVREAEGRRRPRPTARGDVRPRAREGAGVRVAIVGCGAVGSLFAAHLAQLDDVEVWAYDLAPRHVDAINESGLRLSGVGDLVGRLRATSDAAELPPCDFGIVAVKSMHTDAAWRPRRSVREGAVCSVQNGIGNEELSRPRRPRHPRHDLPRRARDRSRPRRLGHGRRHLDRAIRAEPGAAGRGRAACERIDPLRYGDAALADARGAQWTKAIFNASTNPVGALTGLAHGEICDFEPTRR